MFRYMIAAATVFGLSATVSVQAQAPTDYLGVPGPINVAGTDYALAWSSNPNEAYFKQEYLPAGASAEQYESMVLVEFLGTDMALRDVVAAQVQMIEARKATDPVANFAVLQNDSTGEYVLDFLLSTKDENGEFILEWNAYRYIEDELDGTRGTAIFAISERAYGDKASEAFLRGLGEFKSQRILDLTQTALPDIK